MWTIKNFTRTTTPTSTDPIKYGTPIVFYSVNFILKTHEPLVGRRDRTELNMYYTHSLKNMSTIHTHRPVDYYYQVQSIDKTILSFFNQLTVHHGPTMPATLGFIVLYYLLYFSPVPYHPWSVNPPNTAHLAIFVSVCRGISSYLILLAFSFQFLCQTRPSHCIILLFAKTTTFGRLNGTWPCTISYCCIGPLSLF